MYGQQQQQAQNLNYQMVQSKSRAGSNIRNGAGAKLQTDGLYVKQQLTLTKEVSVRQKSHVLLMILPVIADGPAPSEKQFERRTCESTVEQLPLGSSVEEQCSDLGCAQQRCCHAPNGELVPTLQLAADGKCKLSVLLADLNSQSSWLKKLGVLDWSF